jgi:hypothetical protein
LSHAELRLAQSSSDSRALEAMRAVLRNTALADAALDAASGGGRVARAASVRAAAAAALALAPPPPPGAKNEALPVPLIHTLCGARPSRYRTLFSTLRGQLRVFRVRPERASATPNERE